MTNNPGLTVTHNNACYVAHFPDGSTNTWTDDTDDGTFWEHARNGKACEAILEYKYRAQRVERRAQIEARVDRLNARGQEAAEK